MKCLFPGSFDPITFGHLAVIEVGSKIFSQVVVAIGNHPTKKSLFSSAERKKQIETAIKKSSLTNNCKISVITYDGLLVEAVQELGVNIIIRGVRDSSDVDYEMRLAGINKSLYPDIETIFVPIRGDLSAISSTIVKQIYSMGGDVTKFVPHHVIEDLKTKYIN